MQIIHRENKGFYLQSYKQRRKEKKYSIENGSYPILKAENLQLLKNRKVA